MRRLFLLIIVLLTALVLGSRAVPVLQAQSATTPASPPVVELIRVSLPDENGEVTVEGASGAVFGSAYVAVRNLFSGATVYTRAGSTGSFSAEVSALDGTPFWVSAFESSSIPPTTEVFPDADDAGWLPGGPGAVVYGGVLQPEALPAITQISIDGNLADWNAYPDAVRFSTSARQVYAVRNRDSLYAAFGGTYASMAYARVELQFTVDISSYTLTLDPRQAQAATLLRTNPVARDLGGLIVAGRQATGLELRIPLRFVERADRVTLDAVRWLNASGGEISMDRIDAEIPLETEQDGVFRAQALDAVARFTAGGTLPGNVTWTARCAADTLALAAGGSWNLHLDVTYGVADLPANTRLMGEIALQPVAVAEDGDTRLVSGITSGNGWSSVITASGVPIDNLRSEILLGEAVAQPFELVRGANGVSFPLTFALTLPSDLPDGLYVPLFSGYTQGVDGIRVAWAGQNAAPARLPVRLPVVVNVGGVENARMLWTLLADHPSDGSRGVLAAEDQDAAALSNRVRLNSPTYILPPFTPGTRSPRFYPLEPYLLNQLGNSSTALTAPLIQFDFPGEVALSITRPDGTVNDLGSTPLLQSQIGTFAEDERERFGRQAPVSQYRLATLNSRFNNRMFDQYGEYTIHLSGSLRDVWGNRYEGGGTYTILSAELLDLTPGILPGTPFVVGDALNFGLRVSPGVPAEVTVTLRVSPLDGSAAVEQTVSGTANAHGYFQPRDPVFRFETAGEYVIEYEARYTDSTNRLWAASMRGAGVIAPAGNSVIAHGERGLPDVVSEIRPAWFSLPQYLQASGVSAEQMALNLPYYSGDVAWVNDSSETMIQPTVRVQTNGAYAAWMLETLPDYTNDQGVSVEQLAAKGELPVFVVDGSESYTYLSAVRPNVTVRQFVAGADNGGLPLGWDGDDPLNRQIGAGVGGSRPGDFLFLFGGAVLRLDGVENAEGEREAVQTSAIYGALAVMTENEPMRIYPPDRGAAGGADGGALLTINGQPFDAFIALTGVQPGDVLTRGDTFTVAGQVAPTLGATVVTTYTKPSGEILTFTSRANPVGAYYDPETLVTANETGMWTVRVRVIVDGVTSAGQAAPPYPTGGVLGEPNGAFSIFVLPPDSQPLPWNNLLRDTIIPIVSPYNFSFTLPGDWTDIEAYYTLTTPGYVIEDLPIRMNGRTFSYTYNAPLQSRSLPNLENDGSSGDFRADVRTLTFVVTGTDATGEMQIRSRTFTLIHDHLLTME